MDPLSPSPHGSIWTSVSRGHFERNIDELARRRIIHAPCDYSTTVRMSDPSDIDALLPFNIESKLADDFAYISAYDVGVDFVTSATVECSAEPPCLTVRLAANAGVQDCVFDSIMRILKELRTCGKSVSRNGCAERILDIVILLNRNKIFSRVGSKRYEKPAYDRSERGLLSVRFKSFVSKERKQLHQTPLHLAALINEIDEFDALLGVLETSTDTVCLHEIKAIIKQAAVMTRGGTSIQPRLEEMGIPKSKLDAREVREIDKTANYWRICQDLVNIRWKRSYRVFFENSRLERVEPYQFAPSVWPTSQKHGPPNRFVHAEVQLLVHYEVNGPRTFPRVIGSSKEACYLCNAFIKAHGRFCVTKAHRQFFEKWTVPERREYSPESLGRIRRSLRLINQEVSQDLKKLRKQRVFRPAPLQSSINLNNPLVSSPSTSVITSVLSWAAGSQNPRKSVDSGISSPSETRDEVRQRQGDPTRPPKLSSRPRSGRSSVSTVKPTEGIPDTSEEDSTIVAAIRMPASSESRLHKSPGIRLDSIEPTPENRPNAVPENDEVKTIDDQCRPVLCMAAGTHRDGASPKIVTERRARKDRDSTATSRTASANGDAPHPASFTVSPNHAVYIRMKKLHMHIYLEGGSMDHSDRQLASISVHLAQPSELEDKSLIDVRTMSPGEDLIFEKLTHADGEGLQLNLQFGHDESVSLVCKWQASVVND